MTVTNFGFAVMLISSISCLAVGLWMLFIMKHDQRNPKSAGIAMLLMSLGLGLMAVHGAGLFPERYDDLLMGVEGTAAAGAVEIFMFSTFHSFRRRGMKRKQIESLIAAGLTGLAYLVVLMVVIFA